MSAVAIGCFVPDFPYLLSLSPRTFIGHTFTGVLVFDLPLAIAALWLFHVFVKQPMLMFLPAGIRRRLTTSVDTFPFWPSERLFLIVFSILVGTMTHLLWDAFTHSDSWIGQHWTFLSGSVGLPVTGQMQICKFLEYISSAFGLAILALWILLWYRTTNPSVEPIEQSIDGRQRRAFVAALPFLATFGGALRAYDEEAIHLQIRPIVHFASNTLISAITFFLLGLLIYGVILHLVKAVPVRV